MRFWLRRLARRDRLPRWIYGWASWLANAADNADTIILAYVLTDAEVDGRTVGYGGVVNDLALRPDGGITRITLTTCERYLVDLGAARDTPSLSQALSRFPFMVLDAARIRNIAFEAIVLPPEA